MGIETFFFISLAVTFLLLVALVYHFHQKFITLDQRVNNVIDIINSVVKEMQNLKQQQQQQPICCPFSEPPNQCINIPEDSFIHSMIKDKIMKLKDDSLGDLPTEKINISDDFVEDDDEYDSEFDDDSDSDDDMSEMNSKILVSDDEEDVDVDVDVNDNVDIDVEIVDPKSKIQLDNSIEEIIESEELILEDDIKPLETSESESISIISNTDFKKMDISQLRAIVSAKGIDSRKMKKAELLKILEQ